MEDKKATEEAPNQFDLHLLGVDEMKGDKLKYRHMQSNVDKLLLNNKEDRKHSDEDWNKGKDMKKVASLPIAVYLRWNAMGLFKPGMEGELMKMLEKHPELKTTEKRLI